MQEVVELVDDLIKGNWTKVVSGLVMMGVGWYFGKRRARSEWQRKEFFDRLNVSLNSLRDGKLRLRTVLEKSCLDVFLNSVAVETVIDAARHTTPADSTLPLPKDDYWYYLNSVLNEIAEKFGNGALRRDMGQNVAVETYVICLTCESAGEMRTRKIRAMLIQKSVLENLPAERPQLESPNHTTRWETLKQLAAERLKNPHKFMDVEIAV